MAPEATAQISRNEATTHEFVNCLSSVRSLTELLVDYPGLDADDRSRFVGILRDETERLIHLMAHLNRGADTTASL